MQLFRVKPDAKSHKINVFHKQTGKVNEIFTLRFSAQTDGSYSQMFDTL